MSKAISFLSGKGGSGKTTLALSIADLLSRCKIKTLLVDCDLSTNGATYFYESRLNSQYRKNKDCISSSFSGIINSDYPVTNFNPVVVNAFLDFFPSISSISSNDNTIVNSTYLNSVNDIIGEFCRSVKSDYDVVLFDCQAGYTNLLPSLLHYMDVDLFVLEADSISASALRNLHLKIGNHFDDAKVYQVFNKATSEEYKIYSKITGTFFTNIGTLCFDWKIRQAFSRSEIPDLEKISHDYGHDLCEMCRIMFSEATIQKRLIAFSDYLLYLDKVEEYKVTEKKLEEELGKHKLFSGNSSMIVELLFPLLMLAYFVYNLIERKGQSDPGSDILLLCVAMSTSVLSLLSRFLRDSTSNRGLRKSYESNLRELSAEIRKLERKIDITDVSTIH